MQNQRGKKHNVAWVEHVPSFHLAPTGFVLSFFFLTHRLPERLLVVLCRGVGPYLRHQAEAHEQMLKLSVGPFRMDDDVVKLTNDKTEIKMAKKKKKKGEKHNSDKN